MKREQPVQIAERKLTHYLLIPLPKNDKSVYLKKAGYEPANWPVLEHDLRLLAESGEAQFIESSVFGDIYHIIGLLTGPNGRLLGIKPIWMQEIKTGITKFITLYPS